MVYSFYIYLLSQSGLNPLPIEEGSDSFRISTIPAGFDRLVDRLATGMPHGITILLPLANITILTNYD